MCTNENVVLGEVILSELIPKGLQPVTVIFSEYYDYDKHGNWIHRIDTYGREKWRVFDSAGKNIIKKFCLTDGKVTQTIGFLYERDGAKRLTREIDSKKGLFKYSYSDDGTVTTIESQKDAGLFKRIIKHDKDGRILTEETHNVTESNGNLVQMNISRKYEYDDDGKLYLLVEDSDASTPKILHTKFLYDDRGRQIKSSMSNGSWESHEYDDHDRIIKTTKSNGFEETFVYFNDANACHRITNDKRGDEDWYLYNNEGGVIWHVKVSRKQS